MKNVLFENLGFYCCRYLELKSEQIFINFLKNLGISYNNTGYKYHCTSIFSDSFPDFTDVSGKRLLVNPTKFSIFGDYLVMEIKSEELHEEFKKWRELGCNYSFDSYKPHISVLKFPKENLTEKQLNKILNSKVKGKLYLTQEKSDLSV